jgi:hypothetical protein
MTTLAIAIMSLALAVAFVLLALAVILHIASKNSVDRDYDAEEIDAQIASIAAASEPAALQGTEIDEAYKLRRHVKAHQPWGAIND